MIGVHSQRRLGDQVAPIARNACGGKQELEGQRMHLGKCFPWVLLMLLVPKISDPSGLWMA